MSGKGFYFFSKDNKCVLHPVAFGSQCTRKNEKFLHSYLGEGFSGDWAMNKIRHMCYGRQFVWVTGCYAVEFILSYDGPNQSVLRLQMRLVRWDINIVHCTNDYLANADYWSRLDADLCYDPSFRQYLQIVANLCRTHPSPSKLPMREENMPYYCGPQIPDAHCPEGASTDKTNATIDAHRSANVATCLTNTETSHDILCCCPVTFGIFESGIAPCNIRALYNSDCPALAYRAMRFTWAIYGFNTGHFFSTISKRNLPFQTVLACDPYESNRALFRGFAQSCPRVLPSAASLLDHIRGSGDSGSIDRYIIHSHRYQSSEPVSAFWSIQSSIAAQLCLI
jgi:hypothetical protein